MEESWKSTWIQKTGVNVEKALTIESVNLSAVHDAYFTVRRDHDYSTYHIPYLNIVKIIENADDVKVGGFLQHKHTYSAEKVRRTSETRRPAA